MLRKIVRIGFFAIFVLLCTADHAEAHSVSLAWTASTDPGVSYNVYRLSGACPATGTAGFTKITPTPISATTFTDSVVAPGTYCYYATSVLNGAESVPSNLAPAVILPAAPTAVSETNENWGQVFVSPCGNCKIQISAAEAAWFASVPLAVTGTDTGHAWQTISKVNGSTFSAGDSVLFNRGDVWYGASLTVPSSGSSGSPILFGAYGSGANPVAEPE